MTTGNGPAPKGQILGIDFLDTYHMLYIICFRTSECPSEFLYVVIDETNIVLPAGRPS